MTIKSPDPAAIPKLLNPININHLINIDEDEENSGETPVVQMSPIALSPTGELIQLDDTQAVYRT